MTYCKTQGTRESDHTDGKLPLRDTKRSNIPGFIPHAAQRVITTTASSEIRVGVQ